MLTTIVIASSNPHKIREIRELLEPIGVTARGLDEIDHPAAADLEPPDETGTTFQDNADLKAMYYASALGLPCLADDSGLEVDALGGEPGIRSSRYSLDPGDHERNDPMPRDQRDRCNNRKLLDALESVPEERRAARFVCAMALAAIQDASPRVVARALGTMEGRIGMPGQPEPGGVPRGTNGFGYDPLLIVDTGATAAELTPHEKNARSHRGQATRRITERIAAWLRECEHEREQ